MSKQNTEDAQFDADVKACEQWFQVGSLSHDDDGNDSQVLTRTCLLFFNFTSLHASKA